MLLSKASAFPQRKPQFLLHRIIGGLIQSVTISEWWLAHSSCDTGQEEGGGVLEESRTFVIHLWAPPPLSLCVRGEKEREIRREGGGLFLSTPSKPCSNTCSTVAHHQRVGTLASPGLLPTFSWLCPWVTFVECQDSPAQFDHPQDLKFSELFCSSSNTSWQWEPTSGHDVGMFPVLDFFLT